MTRRAVELASGQVERCSASGLSAEPRVGPRDPGMRDLGRGRGWGCVSAVRRSSAPTARLANRLHGGQRSSRQSAGQKNGVGPSPATRERRPPARARRPALRAIIFDLDGTLVDSMGLTFDALRAAVRPYLGRLVEDSELEALLGPPEPKILTQLVGPNLADGCYARYQRLYLARLRRMAPFPGILPMLAECRREGLKIGVFTARGAPMAEQTMHVLRLLPRVDLLVTGDDVKEPKPSPEGIQRVLWEFALKPSEALWVGDSPLDVRAGRSARVSTVGALWGSLDRERLRKARPRQLCETPEELRDYIRQQLGNERHPELLEDDGV